MKLKSIHLLVLLAICWGPSFLFIKIALIELSPLMLATFRIGTGALILNMVLLLKGQFLPRDSSFWRDVSIAGLFSVFIPFLLINWGQQFVSSSLGALLNGMTPFFTVIFSFLILRNEPISENKLKGIFIGFIGLLVLVYPNLREGITPSLLGILTIVLASASYGIGWVYVRKRLTNTRSFQAPAAQLLVVTLFLVPISIFSEPEFSLTGLSLITIGSVASLGLFGTAIAFILYFKLIEKAGASYASMVTYLVPVIGVFLGVSILDEAISIWMILGASLILFGIYMGSQRSVAVCCPEARIDRSVFSKFR